MRKLNHALRFTKSDNQPLRIGLIGFGCVGQGFYDIIQQQPGLGLIITRIAVKSPDKPRSLPADHFTYHADELPTDPRWTCWWKSSMTRPRRSGW